MDGCRPTCGIWHLMEYFIYSDKTGAILSTDHGEL